ncbi:hypothetical protein EYB45_10005 [Erythrobacteraceae bacterium CFH 75059]|uniref:hypothetical protein n=1 Tax=Qipengyuania thermophila TaxID=2509361 RepID=UPI00102293FE|nr:hypothetical protein [Qipengyuania thermophila]TCD02295.1 hypothetical protein EYB45_10005 [Erythrobacteraceae bacterium CFH 75059]
MRTRFEHVLAIDWSGAAGERQRGIALALASRAGGPPTLIRRDRPWSREEVLHYLRDELPPDTLVGIDMGLALPFVDCGAYFPGLLDSPPDARSLWALIDVIAFDEPHLGVSAFVDHDEHAPFFRRPGEEGALFRCDMAEHGRGRFRVTEQAQEAMGCRPTSNFNLVGAAQVGKASLAGMRLLHRLGDALPVWPVDPLPPAGSMLIEIYTAIAALAAGCRAGRTKLRSVEALNAALGALGSPPVDGSGPLDDHAADALLAAAWLRDAAGREELWQPPALTPQVARTEGWTFGAI